MENNTEPMAYEDRYTLSGLHHTLMLDGISYVYDPEARGWTGESGHPSDVLTADEIHAYILEGRTVVEVSR